jgi:hypothetical protein
VPHPVAINIIVVGRKVDAIGQKAWTTTVYFRTNFHSRKWSKQHHFLLGHFELDSCSQYLKARAEGAGWLTFLCPDPPAMPEDGCPFFNAQRTREIEANDCREKLKRKWRYFVYPTNFPEDWHHFKRDPPCC